MEKYGTSIHWKQNEDLFLIWSKRQTIFLSWFFDVKYNRVEREMAGILMKTYNPGGEYKYYEKLTNRLNILRIIERILRF